MWDTLLKEAEEEASIPAEIMSAAKPVGAISYTIVNDYGTSPEVEFVYDLELPLDFVPKNADGEVAGQCCLLEGGGEPPCLSILSAFFS